MHPDDYVSPLLSRYEGLLCLAEDIAAEGISPGDPWTVAASLIALDREEYLPAEPGTVATIPDPNGYDGYTSEPCRVVAWLLQHGEALPLVQDGPEYVAIPHRPFAVWNTLTDEESVAREYVRAELQRLEAAPVERPRVTRGRPRSD